MTQTADPRLGTTVGGYRIESLIGRGRMSEGYLAEHLRLERKVALKLIAPDLAEDPKFEERFVRESRLAASLEHPNIVPIYDAAEADGVLFLSMRYVPGGDLRGLLEQQGRLEPDRTVSILAQAASALDAAHAGGLIHRDVKPGNILITPRSDPEGRDRVYLSDFGLTKRATSDSGITATGQFVGTLDYAAPEQFEARPMDARADVYSLGGVLYECLTGEVPFPRENQAALVYAHLQASPPKVTGRRPELPEAIDAVVATAMAKDPSDRYPTAGALAAAAAEALGVTPVLPTTPSTPTSPVPTPPRRSRTGILLGAGAAVVAVVVLLVVLLNGGGRGSGGQPPPTTAGLSFGANSLVRIDPVTDKPQSSTSVGQAPLSPISVDGDVWVLNAGDQTISVVDPATNAATATFGGPIAGPGMASDSDDVWVGDERALTRLNAATHGTIATVPLRGRFSGNGNGPLPVFVATGGGMVWALAGNDVFQVDPKTNALVRRIQVWPATVLATPVGTSTGTGGIAYGEGAVWASNYNEGYVLRIDRQTGERKRIDIGGNPAGIAVGFGSIWVSNPGSGSVTRIAPATLEFQDLDIGAPWPSGAGGVSTGPRDVWAIDPHDHQVDRIDPISLNVQRIHLPVRPADVLATGDAVWVTVVTPI